jgi:hypothetical protein
MLAPPGMQIATTGSSKGSIRMPKALPLSLLILFSGFVAFSQQPRQQAAPAASSTTASRAQAIQSLDESSSSLQQLLEIHQKMMQMNEGQAKIFSALSKKVEDLSKLAAQKGTSQAQLLQATKEMQETQMSFNLQYLQLQNSMQNENRQFTMISNIMKTKNDTAKNTISNIK